MRVLLGDLEQALLAECSLEAMRLYVVGLRPLVDVASGLVGRVTPVSIARLAIECQYMPPQGSRRPSWKPTNRQVQVLIDELVRVGLAVRAHTVVDARKLVLRLVALDRDFCGQKDERAMNVSAERVDEGVTPSQAPRGFAVDERAGEGAMPEAGERMISVNQGYGDETPRGHAREEVEGRDTPVVMSAGGLSASEAVAVFKQALGSAHRLDAGFVRAAGRLHDLVAARAVSESEIRVAVGDALGRQGVRDPAAYAVVTLESGSLLAKSAGGGRAGRAACGRSAEKGRGAVLSFLNRKFGVAP